MKTLEQLHSADNLQAALQERKMSIPKDEVEKVEPGLVHVHMNGFSVNINKTDEGIVVDVWERGFESLEPLGSTYVFDRELSQ